MRPLIVGNWKCNPATKKEAQEMFEAIKKGVENIEGVEAVICAPFIYLGLLEPSLFLGVGAQDCFWEEKGAYTGEISPKQILDLGCKYIILGHSERRKYQNETDEMINKKLKAALTTGLYPILCVGDKKRESKDDLKEIDYQLESDLAGSEGLDLSKLAVTYEPVWAISTSKGGVAATPEIVEEGISYVRDILYKILGKVTTEKIRILYGGSADSTNINNFIYKSKAEGALVGGASLKPQEFINTVKNARKI